MFIGLADLLMISYQNVDLKTPIKAKATIRNILKHILCLKGLFEIELLLKDLFLM